MRIWPLYLYPEVFEYHLVKIKLHSICLLCCAFPWLTEWNSHRFYNEIMENIFVEWKYNILHVYWDRKLNGNVISVSYGCLINLMRWQLIWSFYINSPSFCWTWKTLKSKNCKTNLIIQSVVLRFSISLNMDWSLQSIYMLWTVPGRVRVAVRLRPRNVEEMEADVDFADCVELLPEVLAWVLYYIYTFFKP